MSNLSKNGCINEKSLKKQLKKLYFNDFFNLICNTIIIKNKPKDIPERWVKKLLLLNGEFAIFDNMILEIVGNNGYFVYDEPTELMLKTPNNLSIFQIPTYDLKWIGANQQRTGISDYLDLQITKLVESEITLLQNLIASRSGDIIGIKDKNTLLSIQQAILQNKLGTPYIVVDKSLVENENFSQIKLSVEYIADKVNQLKQEIYNETLQHFGILNANSNKRERVQVGELEANGDFAYDSIYTIIESANRDLEEYGEQMRFEYNGALDDFTPNRNLTEEQTQNLEKEQLTNDWF